MKTINLRGITESLSESEMKKVKGGADGGLDENDHDCPTPESCGPDGAINHCEYYPSCESSKDCTYGKLCTHYGGISGSCCR